MNITEICISVGLLSILLIAAIVDHFKIECKEGFKKGLGRKHKYNEVSHRKWSRTGNLGFGIDIPFKIDVKYRCEKCGKEYTNDFE